MRAADDPSRFEFARVDHSFRVDGTRCGAWLYRPSRPRDPPLVVTAPGVLPDRRAVAPVAERYAARGHAVLLFAPRHAVGSDGDPPTLVRPDRQLADWRRAVSFATGLDGVGDDLTLRGRGLAGALALSVADGPSVDRVVARSPLVDGRALRHGHSPRSFARLAALALRDHLPGGPTTVRVAGDDPALFARPGLAEALDRVAPRGARTEVLARCALPILRFRLSESDVERCRCPALLTVASDDPLTSPSAVATAAEALPDATLLRTPGDGVAALGRPDRDPGLAHEFAFLDGSRSRSRQVSQEY